MKNLLLGLFNRNFLFAAASILTIQKGNTQLPTANSFSSQINYTGSYRYGVNQGYYLGWSAENTAIIAAGSNLANVKGVGVKSFRVPLYDDFLEQWGLTVELDKFQAYANLGADDNTAFVGSPSAAHRDPTTYPGCPEQSKVFKNLFEPIWLDAGQTQINPNNYYAKYLYDVVSTYGSYIKFWEVINEPDFTYSAAGWTGDISPPLVGSWFDHNPTPDELVNLRAPIQSYIRMLRISWEVIKKLQPDDFVCLGGIGYKSFLDVILRNTDNPTDGSVTSAFPNKGGAYFDVVSFHCYPMYNISVGTRHSDQAIAAYIAAKNGMDNLMGNYGYNGSQYPKKKFICTETGVSRIMSGSGWGSNEGQKNYLMKASVAAQKNNIQQVYWYSLGDGPDPNQQFDRMGLYNYFGNSTPYLQTPSDQGKALKTISDLLYGKSYDATRTSMLAFPSNVDGAAFRAPDGSYVYVIWARTLLDLSETANAVYSFPSFIIGTANVTRKEWDFSETNTSLTISKSNISLSGTPSFFSESSGSTTPPVTAGSGRIEAENYSGMNGIQTTSTQDAGGGQLVGWIDNGDWMDYQVSAPSAGSYAVNLRLASPFMGGQLQIKNSSGSVLATVNVPFTGGFDTWQTVSANISLAAGTQSIRIQSVTSVGFNFNWWEVAGASSLAVTARATDIAATDVTASTASLGIYPNPIVNSFQLQIDNELTGALTVQVYDMQGRVQKQFSLTKTDEGSLQYYLSLGELAAATYIIKATMKGWTQSKQIIKQ